MIRARFKDYKGGSELAMLAAPSKEELEQLKKAVAIMTPAERQNADSLTDEQIQKIAADADIDPANFAIFINGFALHRKRVLSRTNCAGYSRPVNKTARGSH